MLIKTWLSSAKCHKLDAELILLHALEKTDRSWLTLHENDELPPSTLKTANELLQKRLSGIPLAYILGYKEFYGYKFTVTPDVLIPRPETENLIDISLDLIFSHNYSDPLSHLGQYSRVIQKSQRPLGLHFSGFAGVPDGIVDRQNNYAKIDTIIDVGTGSGCIAITLALELQNAHQAGKIAHIPQIFALDNSTSALKVAHQNAQDLNANPTFLQSDLLKNLTPTNALIVANLPYADKNWDWLSPELAHEPPQALYAKDSGLSLIKRLIREVANSCKATNSCKVTNSCETTNPHSAITDKTTASQDITPQTATLQSTTSQTSTPNTTNPNATFLLLEADPCQHATIISYATKHHFHHLLTHHFALLLAHS